MTVDAGACRDNLATLITQETALLNELAGLLAREHDVLVANDVVALEAAMKQRQVTLGQLLRVEDERRSLCRMHGHGVDAQGLERLLAWCDPQGALKALWGECAQAATRCRAMNDKNGAFVSARMKRVDAVLGVLTGRGSEPPTYGPRTGYAAPRSGRMLTTEA